MSLHNPDYLYWLIVLAVLVFIYIFRIYIRKKKTKQWLGSRRDFLRTSISEKKRYLKIALGICVLTLLIIALSRPQSAGEKIEIQNKGIYLLLLIDVSKSMLAEDVHPNRLDFMKKKVSELIDLSSGDQIALGMFANSLILLTPFTIDLSAVKSYLNDLSTDHLTNQGTDLGRALQSSTKAFASIKENKFEKSVKAIVVASDGEDHSKTAEAAAKRLFNDNKIRIFTLSVGTRKGGVIPIKDYRNQIKEYKKDINGNLVITRLKKDSLKKIAKWGKGSYYHVTYGGQAINRLRQDLDRLEKSLFEKTEYTQKKEIYQWFLILAFLVALMELILTDRSYQTARFKGKSWFAR